MIWLGHGWNSFEDFPSPIIVVVCVSLVEMLEELGKTRKNLFMLGICE